MKIVRIFAPYLFAFHFPDETENEFKKVFTFWGNQQKITDFLKENENDWKKRGYKSLEALREDISKNTEHFETLIYKTSNENPSKLDELFGPLINGEYKEILLSKRKAKNSKKDNFLRIYALKIDTNCYVITGGAIKFTDLMEERLHTQKELDKLSFCRDYLKQKGIVDEDSFYDFLIEEHDE